MYIITQYLFLKKNLFQQFSYLQKHQPVFEELKNVKELRETWEQKILAKSTWELLCSNPVHVFQLIKRLKYFEEYIDPLLKDSKCKFGNLNIKTDMSQNSCPS